MAAAGLDTQPSATTYDLEDLVDLAWSGAVRVPHFQRDFRWGSRDVIRLFDSIVKGYPIGSLLLWVRRSPSQSIVLGRLSFDAPATDRALWVVDGQQRLTSLANALHPEGSQHAPFDVSYDLADRRFVTSPRSTDPRYIPIPILFDLEELLTWFAEAGQIGPDYFTEARRVAKLIRQFKIPAYLVRQDNQAVLTDIFDRMNNFGKRLSRAEIFSALFAGPEEGSNRRSSIDKIIERIAAQTGFGTIDDNTILAAILARRGRDPMRDVRSEFGGDARRSSDFPNEDRDTAYVLGEQAIVRAIEFLQREAGVPHLALLTYRVLLIVLTRFFALFPEPAARNVTLLRRFYWRAAASGTVLFGGSFTQVSRTLCSRIRRESEDRSVGALLDVLKEVQPVIPDPRQFKTNHAATKVILCSWWSLRPRSPLTGEPCEENSLAVSLEDQASAATCVYRFYPRTLAPEQRLWAANRLFVPNGDEPGEEYPSLLIDQPFDLDDATWDMVLESNCLNRQLSEYLRDRNPIAFLTERQELIKSNLRNFLNYMAEWEYEDTPRLDSLDLDDDLAELGESDDGLA